MAVTTTYGTFVQHCPDAGGVDSIESYVRSALTDYQEAVNIPELVNDYRDAINAELAPLGVMLAGDEFFGPYPKDQTIEIADAITSVDFWELVWRRNGQ